MYRARRYWDNFSASDPVTQLIAGAAFLILLVVALPRIWPGTASGVDCLGLSSPRISGSNQSILASQADENAIVLELVPQKNTIAVGEPLVMDVRFINTTMSPLSMYFGASIIPFRYTEQEVGLMFSIQSEDGRVLGEPVNVRPFVPIPTQYTPDQIHVLGPRQRCTMHVEVDAARLAASQMGPGNYLLTAVYRNQSKGILPPVGRLTPTPMFPDEGVWITPKVQSNSVTISVGNPPAPPASQ